MTAAQEQPLPSRGKLFFYIPVPENLRPALSALATDVTRSEPDHVTLVHLSKPSATPDLNVVNRVRDEARKVATDFAAFQARVTGLAFFDEATNEGEKQTAVVALVSAPGLEKLREALLSVLRSAGLDVTTEWSYTPHITLGWVSRGERPPLGVPNDLSWEITCMGMDAPDGAACYPLTGTVAGEAVRTAAHADDRAKQRLRLSPQDMQAARRYLRSKPLPPVDVYIPADHGYLVASPTPRGHVLTTALGPGMAPRGVPASDILGPPPQFRLAPVTRRVAK